jgi:hypothetical protein
MNPTIGYDLAKARIADLHHQAQSDALARASRQDRRARMQQSRHHLPGLPVTVMLRMLLALGTRSP